MVVTFGLDQFIEKEKRLKKDSEDLSMNKLIKKKVSSLDIKMKKKSDLKTKKTNKKSSITGWDKLIDRSELHKFHPKIKPAEIRMLSKAGISSESTFKSTFPSSTTIHKNFSSTKSTSNSSSQKSTFQTTLQEKMGCSTKDSERSNSSFDFPARKRKVGKTSQFRISKCYLEKRA